MVDWIRLAGTNQTLEIPGVKLVGVNAENGKKLLITIVLIVLALLLRRLFRGMITRMRPPAVQADEPAMWVQSRQYTGRIVTVSNAADFDEPGYNYTRDFPYLWEEMQLPIPCAVDPVRVESILLETALRHTVPIRERSAETFEDGIPPLRIDNGRPGNGES
jgi:hypothetical protein